MQAIRRKMYFLLAATGAGLIISMLLLIQEDLVLIPRPEIRLFFFIPATMILAALSIREHKKLQTAEMIIDNQILHIRPAAIETGGGRRPLPAEAIEVYISGFGVLLDSEVIKFNMDGIYLKGVEIDSEYLCLAYGANLNTQKTRILHGAIDSREMGDIVEKFNFETGIVPIITD